MIYLSVLIAILVVWRWWEFRYDYRRFQKMYNVKLPFLCTVTLTNERDKILRGVKRHRHIRKDGRKDKRFGFNMKWTYPTTIVVNHFKVKIWNLAKANDLFLYMEPEMNLPLDECPYWGKIDGDMWKFFGGNQLLFQRYIGKLMQYNKMPCNWVGDKTWQLAAMKWDNIWYVHCELKKEPVYVRDIQRVLQGTNVDGRKIFVTNTEFSNGARELAFKNGIALIDKECIRKTFLYEEVMML